MEILERPSFESDETKRVYQYVDRHGRVEADEARRALGLSDRAFRAAVENLTAKQYLTEEDGALSLSLDVGSERGHETEDVAYAVRPARDDDFEQLVDLIQDVTAKRTYAVAEELAEELRYENTLTRHNSAWSRVVFVASVDEYAVGWSHLDLPQTDKLRHTAQVTVGVREEYRGYGIGKRLLDRALTWAESNGYKKVYNSVAETNANAITFLEAHGWETEAVRENHFTLGDRQVGEVMLAYTF